MEKKHSCGFCDEEWVCSNTHDTDDGEEQPCQWESGFPCQACVTNICRPKTPWILIHLEETPHLLKCARCGASQVWANYVALDKFIRDMDYFVWRHKDCEDSGEAPIKNN